MKFKRRRDLIQILNKRKHAVGMEIGVYNGAFSEMMLEYVDFETFFSIDVWMVHARSREELRMTGNRDGQDKAKSTIMRLERFRQRSVIIRADNRTVVDLFPDEYLDFIHIDGAHKYKYITQDIANWWPKMKPGSVFTGHDYCERHSQDVQKAVDEFCAANDLELHLTNEVNRTWMVFKPK